MKIKVIISKTAQGTSEFLQVMSDDLVSVNMMLVAQEITVNDVREKKRRAKRAKR